MAEIKNLEDLLNLTYEQGWFIVNKSTSIDEQRLIDKCVDADLLRQNKPNLYKLTLRGSNLVETTAANKKNKPIDYQTAKKNNPNAIGYTSEPLPFGGLYPNAKPFYDEEFAESQKKIELEQWENEQPFQEPLITKALHVPTSSIETVEEKKSRKRKILDFIGHQDNKNLMQWSVWTIAFIGGLIAFFNWILPYIKSLDK